MLLALIALPFLLAQTEPAAEPEPEAKPEAKPEDKPEAETKTAEEPDKTDSE